MLKQVPHAAVQHPARWESILTQQRQTGLSGAAFCRKGEPPPADFLRLELFASGGRCRIVDSIDAMSGLDSTFVFDTKDDERVALDFTATWGPKHP